MRMKLQRLDLTLGSTSSKFQMVITPDSNVAETEQLLEAMLDSGAICVTKSTTELGVHAQIIGDLRTKVTFHSFPFTSRVKF